MKIKLLKTTDYRLASTTETWSLSLDGNDYVDLTEDDMIRLGALIDEVLNEN